MKNVLGMFLCYLGAVLMGWGLPLLNKDTRRGLNQVLSEVIGREAA